MRKLRIYTAELEYHTETVASVGFLGVWRCCKLAAVLLKHSHGEEIRGAQCRRATRTNTFGPGADP